MSRRLRLPFARLPSQRSLYVVGVSRCERPIILTATASGKRHAPQTNGLQLRLRSIREDSNLTAVTHGIVAVLAAAGMHMPLPARANTPLTLASQKDSAASALNTDLPPVKVVDRSTPQAQTRQEAEDEWQRRRRRSMSLAGA